jgi:hypothetical protein
MRCDRGEFHGSSVNRRDLDVKGFDLKYLDRYGT